MVHWYHAIFSAYGFWLSNDPRGSWSDFVASWELLKYGPATKTNVKQSVAHVAHDWEARRAAKSALKYPPVRFDAVQRECIGRGIGQACGESGIVVHACAIGFDHVHAIVARHAKTIEQVVGQFKGRSAQQMRAAGCHPMERLAPAGGRLASPWAEGCWSVFIEDEAQLGSAIGYVERHPEKEGLAAQEWGFVTRFPRR